MHGHCKLDMHPTPSHTVFLPCIKSGRIFAQSQASVWKITRGMKQKQNNNNNNIIKQHTHNTHTWLWYCVLILCTDIVYWYYALILCTDAVYSYCVLILCTDTMHCYCVLVLCIDIMYWYCVLILCTDTKAAAKLMQSKCKANIKQRQSQGKAKPKHLVHPLAQSQFCDWFVIGPMEVAFLVIGLWLACWCCFWSICYCDWFVAGGQLSISKNYSFPCVLKQLLHMLHTGSA